MTDAYPLSAAQKWYWLFRHMPGGEARLHGGGVLLLRGPHDVAAVTAAVDAALASQLALRAHFPVIDGSPVQRFDLPAPTARVLDLSSLADPVAEAAKHVHEAITTPFDLAEGPAYRALVLHVGPGETAVVRVGHHVVGDGASGFVSHELLCSLLEGNPPPPLETKFLDHLLAEAELLKSDAVEQRQAFWRREFEGAAAIDLGTATSRSTKESDDFAFEVPPAVFETLTDAANRAEATVFAVIVARLAEAVHRLRGQEAMSIGFMTANRKPAFRRVQGCFAQALPLVVRTRQGTADTSQVFASLQAAVANALPLTEIAKATGRFNVLNVLVSDARLPPSGAGEPSPELTQLGARIMAQGVRALPYRRIGALEVLPLSIPMQAFGPELSILVGHGTVSGNYQRRYGAVAEPLVRSFVESLTGTS